ncbi:hypothetical protein KP509_16G009700 [Ceratopteris richardii]|uniref:HTH three-helical bundle domain-containing protein n=1 Tax=Ceratopteris richardii TaxID=49495 RepID=A0A8T2SWM7_CERRI|nr:hypothetical protein KP509_16G009700 [Ceratopteris richardii]
MAATSSTATQGNLFLHLSVSNAFWISGTGHAPVRSGFDPSIEDIYLPASRNVSVVSPQCLSSGESSRCAPQNSVSPTDLLCTLHPQKNPALRAESESATASAISCLTLKNPKDCNQSSNKLRLRILDPQKKIQQPENCPLPSYRATRDSICKEADFKRPPRSRIEAHDYLGPSFGWHHFKKSRSKRHRSRTRRDDQHSRQQEKQASEKCNDRSIDDEIVQRASSCSIDAASCCITEVSNGNIESIPKKDEVDLDWADRISCKGPPDFTSKLDQLAFIACEQLRTKGRRSSRNQRRRHQYTATTFFPLDLIAPYWQDTFIESCDQVASSSHDSTGSLGSIRNHVTLSSKSGLVKEPPPETSYAPSFDVPSSIHLSQRSKKTKALGRQTRVQRCAKQVLDFVGKDTIREKLIRQALGNNPDTSKALRLLLDQRKLGRIGGGGRRDPYKYKLSPEGLRELDNFEEKDILAVRCTLAAVIT